MPENNESSNTPSQDSQELGTQSQSEPNLLLSGEQSQTQSQSQQGEEGNLLLKGDATDPWNTDDQWQGLVPDKFKTAEGEIDLKNLAKSYIHAEKRIGTGDVPPKDVSGYKLEVEFPEGVQIDEAKQSDFLAKCLEKGLTNTQANFIMKEYSQVISESLQMQAELNSKGQERAETVLKAEWKDKFDENLALAQKAFFTVADDADKAAINEVGNNPALLRILAKLGSNLKEDTGLPSEIAGMSSMDIESLQKSDAYWNPKHPDHSKVKDQVTRYYQATAKR